MTAAAPETPATPGQAATPDLFTRWFRIVYPCASQQTIDESWEGHLDAEREFWRELDAARQPQPSPATALRKALVDLVNFWAVGGNGINAESEDLISACSAELLRVLDEHPEQSAPELAARADVIAERDKYRGELENALRVMLLSRDTADTALAIRERTGLLPLKAVKGK